MKIGYAVEGSMDRAFVTGLRDRWCGGAELVAGHFRGSTGESIRREIRKICLELASKGVDYIVFLTDSDGDDWRDIRTREFGKVPVERKHFVVYGVPDRNIEDWLRADPAALAQTFGLVERDVRNAPDAKGLVRHALEGLDEEGREGNVSTFVQGAPLGIWLRESRSFEQFYEDVRDVAQQSGTCAIPNERDR